MYVVGEYTLLSLLSCTPSYGCRRNFENGYRKVAVAAGLAGPAHCVLLVWASRQFANQDCVTREEGPGAHLTLAEVQDRTAVRWE